VGRKRSQIAAQLRLVPAHVPFVTGWEHKGLKVTAGWEHGGPGGDGSSIIWGGGVEVTRDPEPKLGEEGQGRKMTEGKNGTKGT